MREEPEGGLAPGCLSSSFFCDEKFAESFFAERPQRKNAASFGGIFFASEI
jgi:hypothetical protein